MSEVTPPEAKEPQVDPTQEKPKKPKKEVTK